MKKLRMLALPVYLAAACFWGQGLWGQLGSNRPGQYPNPISGPGGDPPSRVARLNYVSGEVSLRPDDVPDWAPASLNFPLTNGYHVWTDRDAHTELHIGSTAIRLAEETAVSILNLDD